MEDDHMKKIAFFDIDETMVNVPKGMMEPSKETIRVLSEFQNQGNYIVVATARGAKPKTIDMIHFDGHIFCDGHYIEFQDKVLVDNLFESDTLKALHDLFKVHNGEYFFSGVHGEWVSDLESEIILKHHEKYQGTRKWPARLYEPWTFEDVQANVVTGVFSTVADMLTCKKQLPADWEIVAYEDPTSIRMDIHLPGFTKGSACEYVIEKIGLDRNNGYAFGDGINDLEMLKNIKHGIAMGNALEEVQAVASDVTDTVDNDGIAKAFKKYFNI